MATPSKEDVLTFELLVDIKASLKAMEQFNRTMQKSMKGIADSGERMGKQSEKRSKKGRKDTDEWANSLENLNRRYEHQNELLKKYGDNLRALRKQSGDNKGQIGVLEKEYKNIVGVMKAARTLKEKGGLLTRPIAPKGLKKAMAAAGEGLKEPLEAFLRKDAGGLAEGAGKIFGATMRRAFHGSRLLSRIGGSKLKLAGERARIAGAAQGGVGGGLKRAGGAAMKRTGALVGGLGKLLRPLATIAPMLSAVGAGMMAIVKLFLDADAMVKDFNKGLLESASTIEFLERGSGNTLKAIDSLGAALEGIQDAAMDPVFNNALGITKDTHMAILNTLTQEGVALGNLSAEAGNTAKGMKALTQSIVEAGVGYSRSLGVPLQEIMTLQAEMAVEMGRSLEDTQHSFERIATAAASSGIAGNKFFSIIRAVSTDLSLWNMRLEGAVDLLGKLGKILNPREAQKFFQSIASGFKNMGRQDLLKQMHYAGIEFIRENLRGELEDQQKALAEQIVDAGGGALFSADRDTRIAEVLEKVRSGYRGSDEMIRTVTDPSKVGVLRQKAAQTERVRQGYTGNNHEASQAVADIESVPRQIDIMVKSIEGLGGSLARPNDVALAKTADALNYSIEQVNQLNSIALTAEGERQLMLERTKDEKERKRIQEMSYSELIAGNESLKGEVEKFKKDVAPKKERTVKDAIEDMSKSQGKLTQSLFDKLANLSDWFMKTFFRAILDIWEAVTGFLKFGGDDERKAKRAVMESTDPVVQRAYHDARGNWDEFKGILLSGGSEYSTALRHTLGRGGKADATDADRSATDDAKQRIMHGMGSSPDKWIAAIGTVVKNKDRLATMERELKSRARLGGNLDPSQLGLTAEELGEVWNQAAWQLSPESIVNLGEAIKDAYAESTKSPSKALLDGSGVGSPERTTADAVTTATEQLEGIERSGDQLQGTFEQQGVKISPATLKEDEKGTERAMLSALRIALFEYYMYSGTDRSTLLSAMASGGVTDPRDMAAGFGAASIRTGSPYGALEWLLNPTTADGNAAGGLVTGVGRGLAVVAAQGEGLASVGKGERILPAGGGGTGSGVNVVVNGVGGPDLARLIEGKVVEGIREYKRREKFN